MSSTKSSPRTRKHKHKDDSKHETIVQVHKLLKPESYSDKESLKSSSRSSRTSEDGESNKAFRMEDPNENYSSTANQTPSRDVSVDGESQINSKILSLIETEMKREVNKHSHFSDSRPQSLSFYEDEKMPEELSGNLELLSPEERKHYKRRKDHSQMDPDERNAYNAIQELYNTRESDEIIQSSMKKSKSRKKRHADPEMGMGDSREMMIPKERKKSKKKRREVSPVPENNKRKHKKREEIEVKTDIVLALEELQDDVFETNQDERGQNRKMGDSTADATEKIYVQKKHRFELANKSCLYSSKECPWPGCEVPDKEGYSVGLKHPIQIAVHYQFFWSKFSYLCHGMLAGLGFGHWLYLITNRHAQTEIFLKNYGNYSDTYICLFFAFTVICIVSSFDMIDLAHIDFRHVYDLVQYRKSSIVLVLYIVCLVLHIFCSNTENKLAVLAYNPDVNSTTLKITKQEIIAWNRMSFCRSWFAVISWVIVALATSEDMLYIHLKAMEKYIPQK